MDELKIVNCNKPTGVLSVLILLLSCFRVFVHQAFTKDKRRVIIENTVTGEVRTLNGFPDDDHFMIYTASVFKTSGGLILMATVERDNKISIWNVDVVTAKVRRASQFQADPHSGVTAQFYEVRKRNENALYLIVHQKTSVSHLHGVYCYYLQNLIVGQTVKSVYKDNHVSSFSMTPTNEILLLLDSGELVIWNPMNKTCSCRRYERQLALNEYCFHELHETSIVTGTAKHEVEDVKVFNINGCDGYTVATSKWVTCVINGEFHLLNANNNFGTQVAITPMGWDVAISGQNPVLVLFKSPFQLRLFVLVLTGLRPKNRRVRLPPELWKWLCNEFF